MDLAPECFILIEVEAELTGFLAECMATSDLHKPNHIGFIF
jgi:hypothetical protein